MGKLYFSEEKLFSLPQTISVCVCAQVVNPLPTKIQSQLQEIVRRWARVCRGVSIGTYGTQGDSLLVIYIG